MKRRNQLDCEPQLPTSSFCRKSFLQARHVSRTCPHWQLARQNPRHRRRVQVIRVFVRHHNARRLRKNVIGVLRQQRHKRIGPSPTTKQLEARSALVATASGRPADGVDLSKAAWLRCGCDVPASGLASRFGFIPWWRLAKMDGNRQICTQVIRFCMEVSCSGIFFGHLRPWRGWQSFVRGQSPWARVSRR